MILIITNALHEQIYNAVINNKYFIDSSGGDIQVVSGEITEDNQQKFIRLLQTKPYKLIIIDGSAISNIALLHEIKQSGSGKIVIVNNGNFDKLDLYEADLYNFIDFSDNHEKFMFDLLDSSVKDIVTRDKIRVISDELRNQEKHFVILNNRVANQKFMKKFIDKRGLSLVDGHVSKLKLFKELLFINDELIFIDGPLRLCEAMYELDYDFEYIDDRDRHTDLPVYVVDYSSRSRRKLKKFLRKKIKQIKGE